MQDAFVVGLRDGRSLTVPLEWLPRLETLLNPSYRDAVAFASSLLYGLLFCLTLRLTGNLWFAVGFHTFLAWGTILCGLGLPPLVGGVLFRPVLHGPIWLTGGDYKPEASVVTPLLIAAAAVGLRYRFPLSPPQGRVLMPVSFFYDVKPLHPCALAGCGLRPTEPLGTKAA